MRALGYSVPFVLLLSGFASLLGLSTLKREPASSDRSKQAPLVKTVGVERCRDGFRIRVDGEVIAFREISLAAEVQGRVATKSPLAKAGTYIRQGDILFEIDRRDFDIEVRRLKETVNQAASNIESSDVEKANIERLIELSEDKLEIQRKEVVRYEELRKKNATSTSQLEAVRNAELQALNDLQTLRNQILLVDARRIGLVQGKERALTDLEQATLNLGRTTISSPIDGVVISDLVEADDYVQRGTPLVQLEDTSKAEVRFSLRMDQLRWLWESDKSVESDISQKTIRDSYRLPPVEVTVKLDLDGHHFAWPARLARYDGAGISPATRTVPCIAVVEDPSAGQRVAVEEAALPLPGPPTLLRGMFVSVEIPVGASIDLLRIPTTALRPGNKVWVAERENLRVQPVRVAHADKDQVVLLTHPTQLAAGDHIVVSPLPLAIDGMEIRHDEESTRTAHEGGSTEAL